MPQVIGGTGFIVSSCLFMLETQSKWYKPALDVLGWHIGFWNLIGALGFTLCGALGFAESNEACLSALTWSTFVGSWAFLVSQQLLVCLFRFAWVSCCFSLFQIYGIIEVHCSKKEVGLACSLPKFLACTRWRKSKFTAI